MIPTAEEMRNDIKYVTYSQEELMLEFAKLHCIEQARVISENAEVTYTTEKTYDFTIVDKDSILNAYDLNLIK